MKLVITKSATGKYFNTLTSQFCKQTKKVRISLKLN